MMRIAWRDLAGHTDTEHTLADISQLADALIARAVEYELDRLCKERAVELNAPIVIAMGKLGGSELNFSSDVDLVFVHPATDDDGGATVAHVSGHDVSTRASRRGTQL